jgi:hypothetical protein
MTISDGVQTVASTQTPPLGAIPGLNSTYEAQWYGPWVGVELEFFVSVGIELGITFEHHKGDYLGIGNWNLRSDFQHPKSFEHVSDATGNLLVLKLGIASNYSWQWLFSIQFQRWQAAPGTNWVFFSDNTVGLTRLREVNWQTHSVSFGFLMPY